MNKKTFTIQQEPLKRGPSGKRGKGVLLAYGFRPFFVLVGLWAVMAMGLWLAIFTGQLPLGNPMPPSWWHGHEMLFGFVAAAAAGFLLTALSNWTQRPPLKDWPLALLVITWMAGRGVMWFAAALPPWLVAMVDLSFLLGLTLATSLPVMGSRKIIQGVFPFSMGLLWVANLLFHLEWLGILENGARTGMYLGVDIMAWVIVMFGSTMLPSFTQNAFDAQGNGIKVHRWPLVEKAAMGSMALVMLVEAAGLEHPMTGLVFLLAAAIHGIRWMGWHPFKTASQPMVWVLHMGYAWLVAGLALRGMAFLTDLMTASTALHAMTVGTFGITILGIMTRVSLAHTGRPILPSRTMVTLFLIMTTSALLRVFLAEASHSWAILASGLLWMVAFATFSWIFLPMLTRPRVDGRPG